MIMYILQGQNGQELHLNICLIFLLQLKDCKMAALSPGGCPIKSFICNWWPNGLKLYNDDGSKTPIKKLADDVGGFGLLVMGGHGQNSKTPAIRFGDKPDSSNIKTSEQLAQAEKAYLDKTDFEDVTECLNRIESRLCWWMRN